MNCSMARVWGHRGGEDVEGFIDELREGVGRIDSEWSKDGEDLLGKVAGNPLFLITSECFVGAKLNACLVESRDNFAVPALAAA